MNRTIEIEFSPDGDIKIEAKNFQGADCEKATRFLEQALGKVATRTKKPEYDAQAPQIRKALQ